MSRSVDLFIDSDLPLPEVAAELGRQHGAELQPDPNGQRWLFQDGSVRAELSEHPYVDDGDLPFSQFRYALSTTVADTARPQDTPEAAALRLVNQKIHHGPGWPTLMVVDMQFRDGIQPAPDPTPLDNSEAGDEPSGGVPAGIAGLGSTD